MYKKFSYFVATMFGVGYCPFASGTAGSLATLPFAFAAAYYGGTVGIAAAAVVVFFAGTLATKEVLKYTKHDPSIVVIDETAGHSRISGISRRPLERNGRRDAEVPGRPGK